MIRLTNFINRALATPSTSPADTTGKSADAAPLPRAKAFRNPNLPAPIGKREQVKRSIGATFSAGPSPTALDAPVNRQARLNAATAPVLESAEPPDPSQDFPPSPLLSKPLSTIRESDEEG